MLHLAGIRLPAELLKIGPGPRATATVSNRSRRARATVPVDSLYLLTPDTGIQVDNARGESCSLTFSPLG
jgi:hypothetical protein